MWIIKIIFIIEFVRSFFDCRLKDELLLIHDIFWTREIGYMCLLINHRLLFNDY